MAEPAPTAEQRAWAEYLAWTNGADPAEYRLTEELAWQRLERALLWLRIRPYTLTPSAELELWSPPDDVPAPPSFGQ